MLSVPGAVDSLIPFNAFSFLIFLTLVIFLNSLILVGKEAPLITINLRSFSKSPALMNLQSTDFLSGFSRLFRDNFFLFMFCGYFSGVSDVMRRILKTFAANEHILLIYSSKEMIKRYSFVRRKRSSWSDFFVVWSMKSIILHSIPETKPISW